MIDLRQFPYFGLDSETTGLVYPKDKAFSFAIATPDGYSEYFDLREQPQALDNLVDQMRHYNGTIICHNVSFDYKMLLSAGGQLPIERFDDTVIRATQINEHEHSFSLDDLCKKYLGQQKTEEIYDQLASIFGGLASKNVQMPRLWKAPSAMVAPYCIKDAELCLALWEWQEKEKEEQGLQEIFTFERERIPTFVRAEIQGIRVDEAYAEEAMDKIAPLLKEEQDKLNRLAGWDVNVNSGPQIKKLFEPKETKLGWMAIDGTLLGTTKTGNPSISAEFLREMKHPAAAHILDIRSIIKTRDTFLAKHILEHAVDGRVYPTINQSKGEDGGTGTGRLSISNPAMQQIPSRNKKIAAQVKPAFLPDEGQVWVNTDMASFEVRIFAHLINNPEIVRAYIENPELDLHAFVAALTGLNRNATYAGEPNAKQLNLSMIFNSGNGAIAHKMGMDWEMASFTTRAGEEVTYRKAGAKAQAVIDKYHRRIPGVKELAEGCKKKAEERGYLFTYTGRRLRFPRGYKSYKASGILIQATAADANKVNWSIIEETLGNEGHLILNTHDSYSMSLPEDWQPLCAEVKENVENGHNFRVPMILDIEGAGKNWWDAIS